MATCANCRAALPNDLEVTVDIELDRGSMVSVNVFAQQSTVNWDRDYARDVLQRIMRR